MAIKIASHLYRNRHGTFYFRVGIPADLRTATGRNEVRFSLGTEQRQAAIIASLPLVGDLPRMIADLRRMTDKNEPVAPDHFRLWQLQLLENARLRIQLGELKDQLQDQPDQIASMVPRSKAKQTVRQAHTLGQLRGRQALEAAVVFPWPPERTKPFSALVDAYLGSFAHRAAGGRKKPPGAKTLAGYEVDIRMFITVIGDVNIGAIDRELAGEYFNVLRRLPTLQNLQNPVS